MKKIYYVRMPRQPNFSLFTDLELYRIIFLANIGEKIFYTT